MTIMLEADTRVNWKPGWFKSHVGGKKFSRYWWLWFAIAFYRGDLKEYGETLLKCETRWMEMRNVNVRALS